MGVYTIVEVKSGKGSTAGWGRLKSGVGWISLDYLYPHLKIHIVLYNRLWVFFGMLTGFFVMRLKSAAYLLTVT